MTPVVRIALVFAALSSFAQVGDAAPLAFNGHSYEFVSAPLSTWTQANAAASSLSYGGAGGYLATITSTAENDFVSGLLPPVLTPDDELILAAYLGGIRLDTSGPLTEGWSWVSGEPWGYTNWAPGEPNNLDEIYLAIWRGSGGRPFGTWNDATDSGLLIAGYVVEYDVPEPTGVALAGLAFAVALLASRPR